MTGSLLSLEIVDHDLYIGLLEQLLINKEAFYVGP